MGVREASAFESSWRPGWAWGVEPPVAAPAQAISPPWNPPAWMAVPTSGLARARGVDGVAGCAGNTSGHSDTGPIGANLQVDEAE